MLPYNFSLLVQVVQCYMKECMLLLANGMDRGLSAIAKDSPQQTRINLVKVKRSSGGTRGGAGWASPWPGPWAAGKSVRPTKERSVTIHLREYRHAWVQTPFFFMAKAFDIWGADLSQMFIPKGFNEENKRASFLTPSFIGLYFILISQCLSNSCPYRLQH